MMSPRTSRVWFWALTAVALLYTALLSWWSPLTSDTYHHALTGMEHCFSFSLVWERCVASYMTWNPRIGEYLAFAVATAGKWLFMLTNENNIPGTWLLLGALFVFVRLVRKEKLPLWFYAGLAFQVAGSLCMLLAPGISARMHSATPGCAEPLSGFWSRWEALPSLLLRMHEYLALPVLLGVAAAWVLWKKFHRDRNSFRAWKIPFGIAAAYILASYAMALSFAAAVIPADHAMFSATLLFGIGVLALLRMWYGIPGAVPRPQITVAVFLALSGICVFSTIHDHLLLFGQHEKRVRLILEQKKAGIQEIIVPPLSPPSPWCSFIFWVDLSQNPEDYVNRGAAMYYGVKSIRIF